jgi:hypothetical protein
MNLLHAARLGRSRLLVSYQAASLLANRLSIGVRDAQASLGDAIRSANAHSHREAIPVERGPPRWRRKKLWSRHRTPGAGKAVTKGVTSGSVSGMAAGMKEAGGELAGGVKGAGSGVAGGVTNAGSAAKRGSVKE